MSRKERKIKKALAIVYDYQGLLKNNPAASYSPTQSPVQYHRR